MLLFLINLVTAIFVGLKLANVIGWGWVLVLSPTIFTIAVLLYSSIIIYSTILIRFTIQREDLNELERDLKKTRELAKMFQEIKDEYK